MTTAETPDAPAPEPETNVTTAAPSEDLPPADPAAIAKEPTPLADEAAQAANGGDADEEADTEEDPTAGAPTAAKAYKADVAKALERVTQDGKGDEDPGESDWQGYATEGVEVEEESP